MLLHVPHLVLFKLFGVMSLAAKIARPDMSYDMLTAAALGVMSIALSRKVQVASVNRTDCIMLSNCQTSHDLLNILPSTLYSCNIHCPTTHSYN